MKHQLLTRQAELLVGYLNEELSKEEVSELERLKQQSVVTQELYDNLNNLQWLSQELNILRRANVKAAWKLLKQKRAALPVQLNAMQWRNAWLAAAAVITFFFFRFSFFGGDNYSGDNNINFQTSGQSAISISVNTPGPEARQVAVLTLSDSTELKIYDKTIGEVQEKDKSVIAIVNGKLTYTSGNNSSPALFHRLVSLGRQDTVTLADGSQVYLMPFTEIHYPVSEAADRMVKIAGEAFFDVVYNSKPFKVKLPALPGKDEGTIEVKGTRFNVVAYPKDEELIATLLEGKVNVTYGNDIKQLIPGQQAIFKSNGTLKVVVVPDAAAEVAKRSQPDFHFIETGFDEVMKQIERQYGVIVQLQKGLTPKKTYSGDMKRSTALEIIIPKLEVAFSIKIILNDNKLIITAPN